MAATGRKTMDQQQRGMFWVTQMTPVTTLSFPMPFMMAPPIHIPKVGFISLASGGLGEGV